MSWGVAPHEGFAEQCRDAAARTGGLMRRRDWGSSVAERAACSCGWRSDTLRPVEPRPASDSPERSAWQCEAEEREALIHAEWHAGHYAPLLGYDPSRLLILTREGGDVRHVLDSRPVPLGALLELLVGDGRWQPVSYQWNREPEQPPTGTLALGAPPGAQRLGRRHYVMFTLPPDAILRWPSR
jgi:hypothetical protein